MACHEGDSTLQRQQIPIKRTASLGENQDIAAIFDKLEKAFERSGSGGVTFARNRDSPENSYNFTEKKRAEKLFFGKISQAPGENRANEQRVQVTAMIAGNYDILAFRKWFRPFCGKAMIKEKYYSEKKTDYSVEEIIKFHRPKPSL